MMYTWGFSTRKGGQYTHVCDVYFRPKSDHRAHVVYTSDEQINCVSRMRTRNSIRLWLCNYLASIWDKNTPYRLPYFSKSQVNYCLGGWMYSYQWCTCLIALCSRSNLALQPHPWSIKTIGSRMQPSDEYGQSESFVETANAKISQRLKWVKPLRNIWLKDLGDE